MSDTAPKGRWFRFSLRTLFVVVTIFACWLAWQVNTVHNRRLTLRRIEKEGGKATVYDSSGDDVEDLFREGPRTSIPFARRLIGDKSIGSIQMPHGTRESELKLIQSTFPEAHVWSK